MKETRNYDTTKINLQLPRSWNECSTEQLELISRIMLEQIERADRYHPFDMRNVKIACFFVLSGMEIVEGIDQSKPIEEQHYVCRLSSKSRRNRFFRRKQQKDDTFPIYLWQLNYWLSPKSKTDDRQSAEYVAAGAGLLDWLDNERGAHLTRFPILPFAFATKAVCFVARPTMQVRRRIWMASHGSSTVLPPTSWGNTSRSPTTL